MNKVNIIPNKAEFYIKSDVVARKSAVSLNVK